MLPSRRMPGSNTWQDGIDEWGRVRRGGHCVGGALETRADLGRFSPPLELAAMQFDAARIRAIRDAYPDHCLIFGTHIGPFTAGYLAMGFERFFPRPIEDPSFIHRLLEARTEGCLAVFGQALATGAEVLVLGDDSAHGSGPMISPRMWRRFVLPMAIEAGFAGIHWLDPPRWHGSRLGETGVWERPVLNRQREGMNPAAVTELFRYEAVVGAC